LISGLTLIFAFLVLGCSSAAPTTAPAATPTTASEAAPATAPTTAPATGPMATTQAAPSVPVVEGGPRLPRPQHRLHRPSRLPRTPMRT
jgi:hypothetical protein